MNEKIQKCFFFYCGFLAWKQVKSEKQIASKRLVILLLIVISLNELINKQKLRLKMKHQIDYSNLQ